MRKKAFRVTRQFLDENPSVIFVFGDNDRRNGMGGAASLRYHSQSYGFITKRAPSNQLHSFYKQDEYQEILEWEIAKLVAMIETESDKLFYISALGSGLANRFDIWDIIKPELEFLEEMYSERVVLLF